MIALVVYCQAAQRLQISGRAALQALRDSGVSIGDGRFWRAWRTAQASIALAGGQGERRVA